VQAALTALYSSHAPEKLSKVGAVAVLHAHTCVATARKFYKSSDHEPQVNHSCEVSKQ
jgi:hypothetical protein